MGFPVSLACSILLETSCSKSSLTPHWGVQRSNHSESLKDFHHDILTHVETIISTTGSTQGADGLIVHILTVREPPPMMHHHKIKTNISFHLTTQEQTVCLHSVNLYVSAESFHDYLGNAVLLQECFFLSWIPFDRKCFLIKTFSGRGAVRDMWVHTHCMLTGQSNLQWA